MAAKHWMSWVDGIDISGATDPHAALSNVMVHVARVVHTPRGGTPAGLVVIPSDDGHAPLLFGFVCEDKAVARHFGPGVFAGTPFEHAPVHRGKIDVYSANGHYGARVRVGGFEIVTRVEGLGEATLVNRPADGMPFMQQGVEHVAQSASISVNGRPLRFTLPPAAIKRGPGAVYAPCGVYAREV